MKYQMVLFLFFAIFLMSSCGNEHLNDKNVGSNFAPVKFNTKIEENEEAVYIKLLNTAFPISFVLFRTSGKAYIGVNDKYQNLDLDLSLDIRDGGDEFLWLFKDQDNYIIMFPASTEEFLTPCLIRVSKNGRFEYLGRHNYSYSDYAKVSKLQNGSYNLEEKNDTIRVIYSHRDKFVMFSELNFSSDMPEPITLEELQVLKSLTSKDESSLIQSWKGKPNDLSGLWKISCENDLTYMSFNTDSVDFSLYTNNKIDISASVVWKTENTFDLYFKNVTYFTEYYKDALHLYPKQISRDKVIGSCKILQNDQIELNWIGLFNKDLNEYQFRDEFVFKIENDDVNPIPIIKCD